MKTVLITGCSSGYGLETARYFHAKGWKVIATMRTPRDGLLPADDRTRILPLDVTDGASIAALIAEAGPIDVLVNNAGVGLVGIFEATPMAAIRTIFETNTFGAMAMVQAVLPGMRERGTGTIVNVTSSAVLARPPIAAAYTASKLAIEGFSDSLAHEIAGFGLRIKLVVPGYAPGTRFAQNTVIPFDQLIPSAYADFVQPILQAFAEPGLTTEAADVAAAVWRAAHDESDALQFPAGPDAVALWESIR